MMKQQNNDMNTKLDNNMTAINTKLNTMMNKMMSMFTNQHATPIFHSTSTFTNALQPTIAAVPLKENHNHSGVQVPQTTHKVPPASPTFPIFKSTVTCIETTPKQNDATLNIVVPTAEHNTNNVLGTTNSPTDPPNVKQKTSNNAPLTPDGKLQQQEVRNFFHMLQ